MTHETRIKDAVNMKDLICLLATVRTLKATVSFRKDRLGLPCLVQLLTWLHVSDYRNFWNTVKYASYSNLSKELKTGIAILVGRAVFFFKVMDQNS